jgi:hypothetical protein
MHDGRITRSVCACLTWLVAACAQGESDGWSGGSTPTDVQSDAPDSESYDGDAAPAPSAFVATSVPPSPSLTEPPGPSPSPASPTPPFSEDGDAATVSEPVVSEPALDDASAGDLQAQDALSLPSPDSTGDSSSSPSAPAAEPPPSVDAADDISATLGDLLITEVMFAPFGARPESEWFEVYNTGTSPVLLSGLTIIDGSMNAHTIASDPPVMAPVSTYVVLVRDRAVAIANGLSSTAIAYEYGAGLSGDQGVQLDDGPSGSVSLWSQGVELAGAPYGSWGLVALGQSLELATLQLVGSDVAESWCYAEYPWAPGSDFGTPGAPNDCQSSGSP